MEKLFVVFVLALTLNAALSLNYRRHKRQSNDNEENSLDDRYGWDRRPQRPWQNQFPSWNGNNGNNGQQWGQNQNQWGEQNQGQQNQWGQNQQNQGQQTQRPTLSPNGNGNTATTQSSAVDACIRACPVTSEYNPVCGSNLVQYSNPGRLTCAQGCGVSVSLLRSSPCPTSTTTPPPS